MISINPAYRTDGAECSNSVRAFGMPGHSPAAITARLLTKMAEVEKAVLSG